MGVETQRAKALKDTIAGFERVFGKEVIFVRSGTDRPLSFSGVVISERPNTIFLDADGEGNVAALLGHEWAHTLALTNPTLHRAMTDAMRPLVIDWLRQEGLLKEEEGYGEVALRRIQFLAVGAEHRNKFRNKFIILAPG